MSLPRHNELPPGGPVRTVSESEASPPGKGLLVYPFSALRAALWRDRRIVVTASAVAVVSALIVTFVRTPLYEATTLLFLTGQSGDNRLPTAPAQLAALTGASQNANAKLVQALLQSRTLSESVGKEAGRARFTQRVMSPDGSIVIRVRDPDPQRAAAVANTYLPHLNAFVSRVGVSTAFEKEKELERQISAARVSLERSEQEILQFQRGRSAPEISQGPQANPTLDAVVRLQQRVTEKEVEVMQLRRMATEENPQLRAAVSELAAYRSQLAQLTRGGGSGVLTPLREAPGLRLSATRLLREFTKNEQLYVSLAGSLAQTRLELQNSLPVVSVIDPATVPVTPVGPSRLIVLLAAVVMGGLLGMFIVIAAEILRRGSDEPDGRASNESVVPRQRASVHEVA